MEAFGHKLTPAGDSFTPQAEIGAVEAVEINADGTLTAEPVRRGGGSALVLNQPSKFLTQKRGGVVHLSEQRLHAL